MPKTTKISEDQNKWRNRLCLYPIIYTIQHCEYINPSQVDLAIEWNIDQNPNRHVVKIDK